MASGLRTCSTCSLEFDSDSNIFVTSQVSLAKSGLVERVVQNMATGKKSSEKQS